MSHSKFLTVSLQLGFLLRLQADRCIPAQGRNQCGTCSCYADETNSLDALQGSFCERTEKTLQFYQLFRLLLRLSQDESYKSKVTRRMLQNLGSKSRFHKLNEYKSYNPEAVRSESGRRISPFLTFRIIRPSRRGSMNGLRFR